MPRRRMIDPGFWLSTHHKKLIFRQRLLFLGMVSNADDEGRLKGDSSFLRATVFPYDDLKDLTVDEDIKALAEEGLIMPYVCKDSRYIQLVKWREYQTINRPTPSKIPAITDDSMSTHGVITDDSLVSEIKRKEVKLSDSLVSKQSNPPHLTTKEKQLVMVRSQFAELQAHNPKLNVQQQFDRWTDWMKATGTNYTDYAAAFKIWLRRANEFLTKDAKTSNRSGPPGEDKAQYAEL